ncbi:hypothetical protein C8Q72DRAFT_23281 [Fomitopsis betulina]|nr:hypothetical protein C8Q72DRAFT_23281 [Fomitopsis betulina]
MPRYERTYPKYVGCCGAVGRSHCETSSTKSRKPACRSIGWDEWEAHRYVRVRHAGPLRARVTHRVRASLGTKVLRDLEPDHTVINSKIKGREEEAGARYDLKAARRRRKWRNDTAWRRYETSGTGRSVVNRVRATMQEYRGKPPGRRASRERVDDAALWETWRADKSGSAGTSADHVRGRRHASSGAPAKSEAQGEAVAREGGLLLVHWSVELDMYI